ncbi:alpha/beta fold hydrolase [Aliikangiella coralliicola]|uniref:Serine aminopeptidase S33 domain-containing protein n=1 Tax=Aliikangiella coralliicola TaxID=2592383 RepID=A0A545U544_9GAMM|nr:alpha/beta hydrolase [Aliikangiella coralliicola]TQV84574.1 hypothetical protein FLL46_23475 [Aliikangiella coralliicola]
MIEKSCQFGQQNRLHGILTQPGINKEKRASIILVNAGFLSTPGPFRLYTLLARKMAEDGFSTLRFDLGGIGNSEQIHPSLTLQERTNKDIENAVDYLVNEQNSENIVLCGLCSGAEDSFRYASLDPRINAVVMIDPHCYQTPGFHRRKYFGTFTVKKIIVKFMNLWDKLTQKNKKTDHEQQQQSRSLIDYQYMDFSESSNILSGLISRGTLLHYIYTGAMLPKFNHRKQLAEMFNGIDFANKVTVDHIPNIEHTQILQEDREYLMNAISSQITRWFK